MNIRTLALCGVILAGNKALACDVTFKMKILGWSKDLKTFLTEEKTEAFWGYREVDASNGKQLSEQRLEFYEHKAVAAACTNGEAYFANSGPCFEAIQKALAVRMKKAMKTFEKKYDFGVGHVAQKTVDKKLEKWKFPGVPGHFEFKSNHKIPEGWEVGFTYPAADLFYVNSLGVKTLVKERAQTGSMSAMEPVALGGLYADPAFERFVVLTENCAHEATVSAFSLSEHAAKKK